MNDLADGSVISRSGSGWVSRLDQRREEPLLQDAFFDGYGRYPSAEEDRQLSLHALGNFIGAISWAIDKGDARFEQMSRSVIHQLKTQL